MATYTSANLIIEYDDSGNVLRNMSNYVTEFNGIPISALMEETHAFGDSWIERTYAGVKDIGEITLKGFYDDTASVGPDVVFNRVGNTAGQSLKITWGGSKITTLEAQIKAYNRIPGRGALTKFEVTMVLVSFTNDV